MATVAYSLQYYFNVQANNITNKIVMESKHFYHSLKFLFPSRQKKKEEEENNGDENW